MSKHLVPLSTIVIAILSAAAGWFSRGITNHQPSSPLHAGARGADSNGEAKRPRSSLETETILATLQSIEARLANQPPDFPRRAEPAPAIQEGTDATALARRLEDSLAALEQAVDLLRSSTRHVPPPELFERPAELAYAPVDRLMESPPEDVDRAFVWMTYREVWDRLGPPSSTKFSSPCSTIWTFETGDDGELWLTFVDGRVVDTGY